MAAAPNKTVFKVLMVSVIFLSDVCTLSVIGAGFLVTTPPAVDGVLTSCGEIRLTCSNDNAGAENTRWVVTAMDSSPVCEVTINHFNPNPATPYSCNEFSFEDITALPGAVDALNSTALVNSPPLDLSGSLMECRAGARSTSPSVGNVTLCVVRVGQLSRPMTVRSMPLANNLTSVVLDWGTFSQTTCSRDTVSYTIAIDGVAVPPENIFDTSYIVSGLEANRMYTASVRTVISNCISDPYNLTFEITAKTPMPVVDTQFFCANSSDSITLALSWMFPSSAPVGVVYPPTSELSVTVLVSNSSGLVSSTTFPVSQSNAFFDLGENENYTISVEANHATTGSSTPRTIPLSTSIFQVDTSTTSQDDRVTVRINDSCIENPTTFMSALSYGSCPDGVTFRESKPFSNSNTALFELDVNSVTGVLCIQVEVSHQSQPNRTLNTLEQQLVFDPCQSGQINSVAGSRVSFQFSSDETPDGMVPHGTVATFGSSSSAYTLDGPSQSTCRNGGWTNLVERQTKLAGWVIAVIVVVILVVAGGGGGGGGYLVWRFCCHHRERSKETIELDEKEKLDEADGNHEQGPTGDEYAVVDKSSKRKVAASENQTLYQDPSSIQHETAPTGDVYAVTEKKQKKKGPTEAELAEMYSVPDKTKGGGLTYASLDMPGGGGGGGGEASRRPAPTEYATVIN